MSKQYKVIAGSQSAHCCFCATVVDTTKPVMIHGEHYNNEYESVCECFEIEHAQFIADALNQRAELLEALKSVQRWLDEEWEEYPFEVAVRCAITRAAAQIQLDKEKKNA